MRFAKARVKWAKGLKLNRILKPWTSSRRIMRHAALPSTRSLRLSNSKWRRALGTATGRATQPRVVPSASSKRLAARLQKGAEAKERREAERAEAEAEAKAEAEARAEAEAEAVARARAEAEAAKAKAAAEEAAAGTSAAEAAELLRLKEGTWTRAKAERRRVLEKKASRLAAQPSQPSQKKVVRPPKKKPPAAPASPAALPKGDAPPRLRAFWLCWCCRRRARPKPQPPPSSTTDDEPPADERPIAQAAAPRMLVDMRPSCAIGATEELHPTSRKSKVLGVADDPERDFTMTRHSTMKHVLSERTTDHEQESPATKWPSGRNLLRAVGGLGSWSSRAKAAASRDPSPEPGAAPAEATPEAAPRRKTKKGLAPNPHAERQSSAAQSLPSERSSAGCDATVEPPPTTPFIIASMHRYNPSTIATPPHLPIGIQSSQVRTLQSSAPFHDTDAPHPPTAGGATRPSSSSWRRPATSLAS